MSIANGTTHYNYPQVQLNDRPTFADFNPAFADIDAKLYSLITGASSDHTAIEDLQRGLGETDLLLAEVKQTADSAKGKADTNAESIILLQTELGNTNRNVANKLDSVAIAEPYDAAAGTYSVDDVVVYNGQRYRCVRAVAVAEPFDADKWVGEDVQTVLNGLSTPAAANVTLSPITGMAATDVQDGISELKSNIPSFNKAYDRANLQNVATGTVFLEVTAPSTGKYLILAYTLNESTWFSKNGVIITGLSDELYASWSQGSVVRCVDLTAGDKIGLANASGSTHNYFADLTLVKLG